MTKIIRPRHSRELRARSSFFRSSSFLALPRLDNASCDAPLRPGNKARKWWLTPIPDGVSFASHGGDSVAQARHAAINKLTLCLEQRDTSSPRLHLSQKREGLNFLFFSPRINIIRRAEFLPFYTTTLSFTADCSLWT